MCKYNVPDIFQLHFVRKSGETPVSTHSGFCDEEFQKYGERRSPAALPMAEDESLHTTAHIYQSVWKKYLSLDAYPSP